MRRAKGDFERHHADVRRYYSFEYKAKSWTYKQRVIAKIEVTDKGVNIRFIVTSNRNNKPETVYRRYCKRGTMELWIKDLKYFRAEECPAFWKEFSEQLCIPMMQAGKPLNDKQAAVAENNIGEYALCDCDMAAGTFDYFISGSYKGGNVPEGMEVRKVEYKRWLKFHFEGGMAAFHNNYTYVYNEWLKQHPEYKAVMAVNVEWYTMGDFNSPDYKCGLMVPVLDNSQKN